jgi:outer membrane protein assembly factor BamB
MKKIFIFGIWVFYFVGCSKENDIKDKSGIVINKNSIWSIPVTDDDSISNTYFLQKAVIYQENVLIQMRKDKGRCVKMIDLKTGKLKWEWSDWIEKNIYSADVYHYIFNNKLTWQNDYDSYQLNLDNGKTIWKNTSIEDYGHWLVGLNEILIAHHLYNRRTAPEVGGGYIVVMNNLEGKPFEKFKPKYGEQKLTFEQNGWYYEAYGVPFEKNGDTYIFVKLNDPSPTVTYTCVELISLYNLTKKEWVYERKKLKSRDSNWGTPHPSLLYKDKAYHGGAGVITCSDLMTGERIWETQLPKGNETYAHAGILIENDKVYANSDGGHLICINANNGSIRWNIVSSGTSTALSYLNGVVYFVGGGDGKLHAVDAETGEYLWKIESPDLQKNKSAIFSGLCAVVPGVGSEKGKIVVTTGLNAYCYEAIR